MYLGTRRNSPVTRASHTSVSPVTLAPARRLALLTFHILGWRSRLSKPLPLATPAAPQAATSELPARYLWYARVALRDCASSRDHCGEAQHALPLCVVKATYLSITPRLFSWHLHKSSTSTLPALRRCACTRAYSRRAHAPPHLRMRTFCSAVPLCLVRLWHVRLLPVQKQRNVSRPQLPRWLHIRRGEA